MTLKNKHATRIAIDFDLLEWLKTEAVRRHCSWAQVIRDLIISEMERRNPSPVQQVLPLGAGNESSLRDLQYHKHGQR